MSDLTTILVPIRYPLTDQSAQTLAAAGRIAHEHSPAELEVLHVNLFQRWDHAKTKEITRAISSTLDGVVASVTTRQGIFVEEVILDEATRIDATIVVVGANQRATWRRLLSRLFRDTPDIGSFLRDQTTNGTEIREVDTTAMTPTADSA